MLCRSAVMMTAAVVLAGGVLAAEDGAGTPQGDFELRERLHKPQDTAPVRQVIVPRHHSAYRAKGGLLIRAEHHPRQVDLNELRERKYRLYTDQMVTHALPGPMGPVSPLAGRRPDELVAPRQTGLAWLAFWTFVAACVVFSTWLLTRVVLSPRRRKTDRLTRRIRTSAKRPSHRKSVRMGKVQPKRPLPVDITPHTP